MIQTTARALICWMTALALVGGAVPAYASSGPRLLTPEPTLLAALACDPDLGQSDGSPVLLVHGTGTNAQESWSSNYVRALPSHGHRVCAVTLPDRALGDIQTSAEYVVSAVRHMYRTSGHKISIVGHSQGGMEPVWAARFWPDLDDEVDDVVGIATPYRGSLITDPMCAVECWPAAWQMRIGSNLVGVLNRGPLPPGPSFTSIGSRLDEAVFPAPEATRLSGASNLIIQDRCPLRPVEHLSAVIDAVYFAYVLDALDHPGPARLDRVPSSVCGQVTMPGIDLAGFAQAVPKFVVGLTTTGLRYPMTAGEPPLRAYTQ